MSEHTPTPTPPEGPVTVAVIPAQGPYTITQISPGTQDNPWHADLVLAATGTGVQFWIQNSTEAINFTATSLAHQLHAVGRWDYLHGPVLVCGSTGNDRYPEHAPPLALILLETQPPIPEDS